MQLTWTAPVDVGLPVLHGYRIERAADASPRVWTVVAADTGSTATTWADADLTADTMYHYRVAARNSAGPGTPSAEAQGRTRPQAALKAGAAYPLTARRWPAAEAPATHTWAAHDAHGRRWTSRRRGPAGAAGTGCCASARAPTVPTGCRPTP